MAKHIETKIIEEPELFLNQENRKRLCILEKLKYKI